MLVVEFFIQMEIAREEPIHYFLFDRMAAVASADAYIRNESYAVFLAPAVDRRKEKLRVGEAYQRVNRSVKLLQRRNAVASDGGEKYAEKQKNCIFGGRLGEYKYYNMDDVIESALNMLDTL